MHSFINSIKFRILKVALYTKSFDESRNINNSERTSSAVINKRIAILYKHKA